MAKKSIFAFHWVKCFIETELLAWHKFIQKTSKVWYGQALKRRSRLGVFSLPTHLQMFYQKISSNKKVVVAQYPGMTPCRITSLRVLVCVPGG